MRTPFPAVLGRWILRTIGWTGGFVILLKDIFIHLLTPPYHSRNIVGQICRIGTRSLIFVVLTAVGVGAMVALQMYFDIDGVGGKFLSRIVSLSFLPEAGPALTSLLIAAQISVGLALDIGTVASRRSLSTYEIKSLVVPRVLGVLIALPLLVVAANIVGVAGGGFAGALKLGLDPAVYAKTLLGGADISSYFSGFLKTPFFALVAALIGCFFGLRATTHMKSKGLLVGQAVLASAGAIFITDYFLNRGFWALEQWIRI